MRVTSMWCKALMAGLACGVFAAGVLARPGDDNGPVDKLKALQFREIGPSNMGGRTDDFAVVESNPNIIFVGFAAGGVWKTVNNGTTWTPVFDKESNPSVGDIAIAPSDPSVVWIGTGEPNNRQSSSWGEGVFKSVDGGATWQKMGLAQTHHIGRIVINPTNPDIVYVAALGHLWGPNPERGLYKTTDGGKTWTQSLKIDNDTGVSDVAMDLQSPNILYAGAYERRRTPFGFNGGGPGGGIYKTTDGGVTWKKLTKGLPYENGGDVGRIGLDIYRRDPNIVYALVQHQNGGVFRSEDKGETWTKMGDTDPRPSYFSQIRVDPNNDLRLWAGSAALLFSEDGGKTFNATRERGIHPDFHGLWIDPANSNHLITGCDGGINITYDNGRTWDVNTGIAIGQFYEVGLDNENPYHICGGLQDNGSWCGSVRTLYSDGIRNEDWKDINGGDGFYAQIDPAEPWIIYSESQDGSLGRRDSRSSVEKFIAPEAKYGEHYRFQWNSPIILSVHDHNTVYYGGNYLFKSTDRGDSWTRLGPDLTTGMDRGKAPILGKLPDKNMLSRHDGVQDFPTITTIGESPVSPNILWVGTDDGNLQVTRDGGKNWKNVVSRVPGLPRGTYVTRVVPSKYGEGIAFATFDGHRADDYAVYIYVTSDYGENWKPLRNGIPESAGTVHVIREHPRNQNLLFAGTEFGLWISWDRGQRWYAFKNNLPTVPVDDIQIQARDNDLVLATHGRSVWVLDDITPIEKMDPSVLNSDITIFPPRPAIMWHLASRGGYSDSARLFHGKNPPSGLTVSYYLKEAVPAEAPKAAEKDAKDKEKAAAENNNKPAGPKKEGKVKITVYDADGKVLGQFEGPGAPGVNRATWNLHTTSASEPTEEEKAAYAQAGIEMGLNGPEVEPGEYTIKISAAPPQPPAKPGEATPKENATPNPAAKEASQKVTVQEDPRVQFSASDRAARRTFINQLYEMAKTLDKEQKQLQGLKKALKATRDEWAKDAAKPDGKKIPEDLQKAADDLQKKVDTLSEKFEREPEAPGNAGPPLEFKPEPLPGQINMMMFSMDYPAAPGGQQRDKIAELTPIVQDAEAQFKKIMDEDLPALNKKINDAGIPRIVP